MGDFLQLHILTSYGPSNLNRDDLNRPKTAVIGGAQRLRISSQCLKRAWRTSDVFENALAGHIGTRTKDMGKKVYQDLVNGGVKEKDAKEWAIKIASVFGKSKKENTQDPLKSLEIEQLVHFNQDEISGIIALVNTVIGRKKGPEDAELNLLKKNRSDADIAMFGRMLADAPKFNAEAAIQVSHAFTVHKAAVEDDYFSAVDDLNSHEEHAGSGHIGEAEFGSGLYYLYICVDKTLLKENLAGNNSLVKNVLEALVETSATISPTGKQNSFASRSYASYILAEKGESQPRSLMGAFLKPILGNDVLIESIQKLEDIRNKFNLVYGIDAKTSVLNINEGKGTLKDLKSFCSE